MRLFEADEVRRILEACGPQLRAMMLLAVNCTLGPSDLGQLEPRHIDLDRGWLDFPRPKTSVDRRAKLWPETVDAIRKWLKLRPECDLSVVFLTHERQPWYRDGEAAVGPLSAEFSKLLKRLDREAKKAKLDAAPLYRRGRSFYALRHSHRTAADECGDQVACGVVMGHADNGMAATYRERIDNVRLERVAAVVHAWLWPDSICQ